MLQVNLWVVSAELSKAPCVKLGALTCGGMGSLVLSRKEPPANAGDTGSIPGSGRSPGEGNGNTLKYSCLGNPMDRGAWQAAVHGVVKSRTQLSD